jgi:hypothetical protein
MNEFQFEQKKSFLHNKHQGKLKAGTNIFVKNNSFVINFFRDSFIHYINKNKIKRPANDARRSIY